jgi:polar amino acid transport system substrate-binding protein
MKAFWLGLAAGLFGLVTAAGAETLTVGAYPANPPWEMKTETGDFEGFEIDLVNAIGEKLGVDVEFQDLGFQALFAATASGRIDAAISSITITNERLQNQDFTQGYYDADLGIGAKIEGEVKTLADLKGRTVGVLATSTGDQWAQANKDEVGIAEIRSYPTNEAMLLDTFNGRTDASITDVTGMTFAFQQMQGMEVVDRIRSGDRYAIMLGKGSEWTPRLNQAISELKEDGTLATIYEKWFGEAPDPSTSTVMVVDLPTAQ